MRRIGRIGLPVDAEESLRIFSQSLCREVLLQENATVPATPLAAKSYSGIVQKSWRNERQKKVFKEFIVPALEEMAGPLHRCYYCSNSRGDTIDHYRPKSMRQFMDDVFAWANFLLLCNSCNLNKREEFPVDDSGLPQLICPALHDPWRHLTLDSASGFLVPRVLPGGKEDSLGKATLECVPTINSLPAARARIKTIRGLRQVCEKWAASKDSAGREESAGELRRLSGLASVDAWEWFFVIQTGEGAASCFCGEAQVVAEAYAEILTWPSE